MIGEETTTRAHICAVKRFRLEQGDDSPYIDDPPLLRRRRRRG